MSAHFRLLRLLLPALIVAGLFAPPHAAAGEYSVSPLRIELDREARSSAVTLTNSGTERMDFQISVMGWAQEADGRERYTPSNEIVFFPKILSLQPGESRVVRVGVQAIPVATERTYRLFIEPLQIQPKEALQPGANIAVNLRFALPVFVKPPQRVAAGDIDDATLQKGVLKLVVRNTGNEHLRMEDGLVVTGRDAKGVEVFTERVDNRYVLAGMSRAIAFTLPKNTCARLSTLELTARAEQLVLSHTLNVNRASCE
ncbi:MAG: fimbria/pilus periplasmic chaperone [Betaproteobacteria bacterium]